jgi:heat-inducible transcriptional repressor
MRTSEVSGRRHEILLKTLEMYISSGMPVSSAALADEVEVSSSTVRSELATLESCGLLTHPHTSAGRVPTDAGYRYYVDALIEDAPDHEGSDFDEFEESGDLDELLRGVSEGMSEVSRLLAVVAGPGVLGDAVSRVDYLPLREGELFLVVSLQCGASSSTRISLPSQVEEAELREMFAALNAWLEGHSSTSGKFVSGGREALSGYNPQAVGAVLETVELLERATERGVFIQGASALLSRLDELDPSSLATVIEIFERRRWFLRLLGEALQRSVSSSGVVVSIGEESGFRELSATSLVAAAYERQERPYGVVSLIGPKRMDYERAIFTVRSAAETLTQRLNDRF